jgi:protocatechuate 3,4-dioxygenase beta subunit
MLQPKRNPKRRVMNKEDRQDRAVSRRDMLAMLGAAGATIMAGPSFSQPGGAMPSCVITPEQTEGPYFVDERLHRSDIRTDPSTGAMAEGTPLMLRLSVFSVGNGGCRPLAGALVDIWQCDALGRYSDARDPRSSTAGKKFLRGYQIADANGSVRFISIYPGWYPGRTVHIHFKVRADPKAAKAHELTSQLYFDDAATDRAHAREPYAGRSGRRTRNEDDGIFRDGGKQLMLRLAEDAQGYAARFDIGLRLA